jgi:hypothetical protein
MGRGPHGSRRRERLLTMRVAGKPGAAVPICPTGKSVTWLSSPICKNISVLALPKSLLYPSTSRPTEGRIMIVTNAGWDAVDAAAPARRMRSQGGFPVSGHDARRRTALKRTAKSCGPDASTPASSLRRHVGPTGRRPAISADDGDKQARSPGRARSKPLKPLRAGMPGESG